MREFYRKLPMDKIKINRNKKLIPMELFLSFLTVETQKQTDFLGSYTGWTQYTGENNLIITGGVLLGVNYLDHILYGKNLDNPYNNYVNPFYLFDIMNENGKRFFIKYYEDDINKIKELAEKRVENAQLELEKSKKYKEKLFDFWEKTFNQCGA